jgi:toxin-antitoxin system PIN domain toxin
MRMPDVNVLIYAHRSDYPDHDAYGAWLEGMVGAHERFALSELVLSGFVRVVTNRKVFRDPTPPEVALHFCSSLRSRANAVVLQPGPRHWSIFDDLVRASNARGGLVSDAYHAALAIEYGCTWASTDSDFARFPGLRWEHPLASQ